LAKYDDDVTACAALSGDAKTACTDKKKVGTELKEHRTAEWNDAKVNGLAAAEATAAYKANVASTTAALTLAEARVAKVTKKIEAETTKKNDANAAFLIAEKRCKQAGYDAAQKALATLTQEKIDNKKKYDGLKDTYKDYKILKPLDPNPDGKASPVGTDCSIPIKDGAPGARPVCKEELCCGAATKFLRDGTKLRIETCQKKTDLTYTYYPPLGDKVVTAAPKPETWRFTCISGAKNLAATATAALAAAYLMA